MDILDAVILGVVQGITEFLPISSTGHLILVRELFGYAPETGLAFDALLHLATACAVGLYFKNDLYRLARHALVLVRGRTVPREDSLLLGALVVGTLPAVLAGVTLEETMETTFRSATLVAWVLLAGSLLFLVAEWVHARYHHAPRLLTLRGGLAIGLFQALALIPGVSRSGATISGGLLLGLGREQAARFAFLLSFPIILGAGTKKLFELAAQGTFEANLVPVVVGCACAFLSGIVAIHWLLRYLRTRTLLLFVIYRTVLAFGVLVFA